MTIEKFLFLQERGNCTVLDKVGAGQRLLHGFARGDSRSSRWVEFRNLFTSNRLICIACCFRHAIRAWNLLAWDPCSRDVPIQPTQSQIPDKNLASEHLVGDWGNLLGHLEGQLGCRDDPSNGSALVAGALSLARARRSARCRRRHAIQRQLWDVLPHSEALDKQLRKRYHKTNKNVTIWSNARLLFQGPHKFPDFDTKIQRLKDMGVSEYDARAALSRHNWDLNRATEQIFS